ncbi:MAG: preprotein translocase subunit SecG [Candidatus Aadella gelida]|nr:preprotein translocase subunit SecG [Candidatus Aadella gelida]
MYIFLIVVHITVCLVLIATILLQAGKGGGLTEAFGGESNQSVFGTQTPHLLKKATTISAIAFLLTSLFLGMITARRGKSLFDRVKLPAVPVTAPAGQTVAVNKKETPVKEEKQVKDEIPVDINEEGPALPY